MSKKQILISTITVVTLIAVSGGLFLLAQGYRIDLKKREVTPTGILVVNSTPDGALIFLNDIPKDATNTSITALPPGKYQLQLKKQGYNTYQSEVVIKKELVTKIEAILVPLFPEFKPLTFTSAQNPTISPSGEKIIFTANQNGETGLWLLDLSERPFNLSSQPSQLLANTPKNHYSQMDISWAPDSKQVLLDGSESKPDQSQTAFLLNLNSKKLETVPNAAKLKSLWQTRLQSANQKLIENLPTDLANHINNLPNPIWSPDKTKLLYKKESSNQQIYNVLDLKPKNVSLLPNTTGSKNKNASSAVVTKEWDTFKVAKQRFVKVIWYPDSQHLLILEKDTPTAINSIISLVEIDGHNLTQIFTGRIQQNFLASYPNGSKIVVLTNFNPKSKQYNLYSINLR